MSILIIALLAGLTLLTLAVLMGTVLGWANRALHVEVDPRQEKIAAVLPGANCGGCGFVGCGDYAEALVVKPGTAVNLCPVGGEACAKAIAGILGVEIVASAPMRPVVHCAANHRKRLQRRAYRGEDTCQAANLVSGVQGCTYGCLGFGDCERACKYDAIRVVEGLATVDYVACIGCGACAKVCPRNIISMVPFKADRVFAITCSNKDFGKAVSEVCLVGCIGCKACAKTGEVFTMQGDLARIDYEKYRPGMDFQAAIDKCPREVMVWLGKPSPKDILATKDQELPPVVEADFKTTVDKTDWQG